MNRSRLRLHHPRRLSAKCAMAAQLRREKRSEGLAAWLSRVTAEQKLRFCRLKSGLGRRGGLFRTRRRHSASLVRCDRTTGVASRGYHGTFQAHWESDKIYLFQSVSWLSDQDSNLSRQQHRPRKPPPYARADIFGLEQKHFYGPAADMGPAVNHRLLPPLPRTPPTK